jgi:hypothetical protein
LGHSGSLPLDTFPHPASPSNSLPSLASILDDTVRVYQGDSVGVGEASG